jgi:hypothetical protein
MVDRLKELAAGLAFLSIALGFQIGGAAGAEITCIRSFGKVHIGSEEQRANALKMWGRIPPDGACSTALIRGTITSGDSAKFAQFLRANHPFINEVLLSSPGGLVEEAIKIGRLIRKELLATRAPYENGRGAFLTDDFLSEIDCGGNCQCASACFLIWAGGVSRTGHKLGLHRPTTSSTTFASLPAERASVLYRNLLSEIKNYLAEMEIPNRFAEIMTDISSRDIQWLSWDEADSLEEIPSITEWITSSCGAMTKTEKMTMLSLTGAKSQRDRMLYDLLSKRSSEINWCGTDKITKARRAIKEIADN